MTTNLEISRNYRSFHIDNKPFYPLIYDGEANAVPSLFNAVTIALSASVDQDLSWEKEIQLAQSDNLKDKLIVWELDLKIDSLTFSYENQMQAESFKLAISYFCKKVFPLFADRTLGVILYRGSPNFLFPHFWTEKRENDFELWEKEGVTNLFRKEIFAAEVFIDYLKVLLPVLDDLITPILLFDTSSITNKAFLFYLFSKMRFEHFILGFSHFHFSYPALSVDQKNQGIGYFGKDLTVTPVNKQFLNGICFPIDEYCTTELLDLIEQTMNQLIILNIPCRIIYESHLADDWDGLDHILVFSKGLSPMGKRKLLGFCAAGGMSVYIGESLKISQEISFGDFLEENRGRGI